MIRFSLFLTLLTSSLGCGSTGPAPLQNLQLVWEDSFDGPAGTLPSSANWNFDLGTDWGNAQLEYDTDRSTNVSLDGNGHLVITARQESYQGRNYTSARITTNNKFETDFGRVEARIKIPTARGIWPAFWMLGADFPETAWPRAGEIDILENFGREPNAVQSAIHGPGYSGGNSVYRKYTLPNGIFSDDFHLFAVEWTADVINFFVDQTLYHTIRKQNVPGEWVFSKKFFILLNLAVGGGPAGPPDGTTFPQVMQVDYVRVYR